MSWSQIAIAALSVLGLITGLNGLAQAAGLGPRDPLVDSLDAGTLALLALAIYVPSGWGLAWALARGDQSLALRRFPLILSGGVLLIALAAAAGSLLSSSGGGSGGSDGPGSRSRRASKPKTGLAAAVCDLDLAQAALGGGALDGPRSHDNPIMRRSSMCSCTGPAGTVTLTVAPADRAGSWAADPTNAFPLVLASDARWAVRTTARPADGHDVDQPALQQLADRALASLPS
jgi:hypothetical protein